MQSVNMMHVVIPAKGIAKLASRSTILLAFSPPARLEVPRAVPPKGPPAAPRSIGPPTRSTTPNQIRPMTSSATPKSKTKMYSRTEPIQSIPISYILLFI